MPQAQVWVRTSNPRSAKVQISPECRDAASLFLQTLAPSAGIQWPLPIANNESPAYADAWASEDEAGIGGWWCDYQPHLTAQIQWFHVSLTKAKMPPEWQIEPMQSAISSWELLAQAALLLLRPHLSQGFVMNQRSDNVAVVGATAKGLSSKSLTFL